MIREKFQHMFVAAVGALILSIASIGVAGGPMELHAATALVSGTDLAHA